MIHQLSFLCNYLVVNIKTFFDFYLPKYNIMIETDGDYYHCNPDTIHAIPKYKMQFKNLSNDKRKNTWANNHDVKLLRYWESDINARPEWVMEDLKKHLFDLVN